MAATQFPAWTAGSRITAAMLLQGLPFQVRKPTDESLSNSTVLQNDNDLLCTLAVANASYWFELMIDYEAANGGDLKIGFSVPAGAAVRVSPAYLSGTVAVTWNELTQANTTFIGRGNGSGSANSVTMTMVGSLLVGGTTGTFQLQWAQGTTSATATIVHAGSALNMTRIS